MKIYAIGRAFVDYFFDESIDIPIKSNSPHVTSSDFEKIINQIKSCPKKNLLIESGGSVSNTAKTLAFLGHSVIFVGTIGKKSSKTVISSSTNTNDEPNPDEDGVFFVSTLKKHGRRGFRVFVVKINC